MTAILKNASKETLAKLHRLLETDIADAVDLDAVAKRLADAGVKPAQAEGDGSDASIAAIKKLLGLGTDELIDAAALLELLESAADASADENGDDPQAIAASRSGSPSLAAAVDQAKAYAERMNLVGK